MSDKESPKIQEMGLKKYKQMIEKENKFYDQYKAGRKDPKTGQYYYNISTKNPLAKTKLGRDAGCIECLNCGYTLSISTATVIIICSQCKSYHIISRDKHTNDIEVSLRETTR